MPELTTEGLIADVGDEHAEDIRKHVVYQGGDINGRNAVGNFMHAVILSLHFDESVTEAILQTLLSKYGWRAREKIEAKAGSANFTPLSYTVTHSYNNVARLLLRYGADTSDAMRYAQTMQKTDMVQMFKQAIVFTAVKTDIVVSVLNAFKQSLHRRSLGVATGLHYKTQKRVMPKERSNPTCLLSLDIASMRRIFLFL